MRRIFILSIINLVVLSASAQADCVMYFTYKGEIKGNMTVGKIQVPSTAFLMGYEPVNDKFDSYVLPVDSNSFQVKCRSHLSSDFCMDKNGIVERVFKKVESYPVTIFEQQKDHTGKYKMIKINIPTDQIKFVITESKELVIELPVITIP